MNSRTKIVLVACLTFSILYALVPLIIIQYSEALSVDKDSAKTIEGLPGSVQCRPSSTGNLIKTGKLSFSAEGNPSNADGKFDIVLNDRIGETFFGTIERITILERNGQTIITIGGILEGDLYCRPEPLPEDLEFPAEISAILDGKCSSGFERGKVTLQVLDERRPNPMFNPIRGTFEIVPHSFECIDFNPYLRPAPGSNGCIATTNDNDNLIGTSGNDCIDDKSGNDKLSGAAGQDRLIGGNGNDELTGGSGPDTFVCGCGTDKITDFKPSEGDRKTSDCEQF